MNWGGQSVCAPCILRGVKPKTPSGLCLSRLPCVGPDRGTSWLSTQELKSSAGDPCRRVPERVPSATARGSPETESRRSGSCYLRRANMKYRSFNQASPPIAFISFLQFQKR